MQEGFGEWFRDWLGKKVPPSWRLWVWLLLTCIGAAAYIWAKSESEADLTSTDWRKWSIALAGEVGYILVYASITGAVLKILVVEGFFKQALSEILIEERYIARLERVVLIDLWRRLTTRIYAPVLFKSYQSTDEGGSLAKLADKLTEAVGDNFNYDEIFYLSESTRELTFTWNNESDTRILNMKEWLYNVIVPFDKSSNITYTITRTAEAHLHIDDYDISDGHVEIKGGNIIKVEAVRLADDLGVRTTYTLGGGSEYRITRTRTLKWAIDQDPSFSVSTPYVVAGGSLIVRNMATGLRIIFQERGEGSLKGSGNLFEVVRNSACVIDEGGELRRRIARVLLPHQGFQLIFIRPSPSDPLAVASPKDISRG